VRTLGAGPRLRRHFSAAQQDHFEDEPYGGFQLAAGSDVLIRITNASTNGLDVIATMDIVVIKL
jgi:hypothetical protein